MSDPKLEGLPRLIDDRKIFPKGESPRLELDVEIGYRHLVRAVINPDERKAEILKENPNFDPHQVEVTYWKEVRPLYDQGTRLLNKTFFYEYLNLVRAEGLDHINLAIFDLDFLKAYNGLFGEPKAGDLAIAATVDSLTAAEKALANPSGGILTVRLDGDTFAVIFSEARLQTGAASDFINRFPELLGQRQLELGEGTEKFRGLTSTDQEQLRQYLVNPKISSSGLETISLKKDNREVGDQLGIITQKIEKIKKEKRPKEIADLVKRLG